MADKIITDDILQQAIQDTIQIISDNIFEFESYNDTEIANLFSLTPEEAQHISDLIADTVISQYKLWSSKKVNDEILSAKNECNDYTDDRLSGISSISLKYCTALPSVGESNCIYILKSTDSNPDTLNLYDETWITIGSFTIKLDDYYKKSEVDTKLDLKADKTEILAQDDVITDTSLATTNNVLSATTTLNELDKKANDTEVVKKTDITTTIDSTSTDDTVPSAKVVYEELDEKITNSYYKSNNSKKGIVFDDNADGSYFTLRPYLPQNMLQITKNDSQSLLNVYSDGTIESKGNRNINDLVVAYTNELTNVLFVDTNVSESQLNNAGIVTSATPKNKPSDVEYGVREVLWVAQNKIIVRITGVDTSGMPAIWINHYNGTDWVTWRKV